MLISSIIAILRALWIWPLIVIVFVGLILAGEIHGPWNYYWLFAMGCWLVLDIFWVLAARATKPIVPPGQLRRAAVTSAVVHLLYCLPLSFVPLLGQPILPHLISLEILGACLCVAGVGFAIWARQILAGNWNAAVPLQTRHTLVQTGPYALVRHPIYLGFLLAATGMFLILGEVRGLVCLCHVTKFFKKMTSEETLLREIYPAEYPDYERRVKRLLPCLW